MQSINIMKLEKYAMHKYIGVIIMDEDEKNNLENRNPGDAREYRDESKGIRGIFRHTLSDDHGLGTGTPQNAGVSSPADRL